MESINSFIKTGFIQQSLLYGIRYGLNRWERDSLIVSEHVEFERNCIVIGIKPPGKDSYISFHYNIEELPETQEIVEDLKFELEACLFDS